MMLRLPLTLALLTAGLVAQKTWIVDQNNGPGTHYTDIAPAFAAAKDGDIILVRSGRYKGAATNKALRMYGESLPTIQQVPVTVNGLAAGKTFVMKGFNFLYARVQVLSSKGMVHLSGLTGGVLTSGLGITVTDSSLVTINNCTVDSGGGAALNIRNSTVVMCGTNVTGQDQRFLKYGFIPGMPAVSASSSDLVLVDGTIKGGSGGKPAMALSGGSVTIAGPTASYIGTGNAAITTSGGTVVIDPTVKLSAGGITGNAKVTKRPVAVMMGSASAPGGSFKAEVYAKPGEIALLGIGAFIKPLATPFGRLWVHPATLVFIDIGVVDKSGKRSFQGTIPNEKVLWGLWFGLQGVTTPIKQPQASLTTPTAVILH